MQQFNKLKNDEKSRKIGWKIEKLDENRVIKDSNFARLLVM